MLEKSLCVQKKQMFYMNPICTRSCLAAGLCNSNEQRKQSNCLPTTDQSESDVVFSKSIPAEAFVLCRRIEDLLPLQPVGHRPKPRPQTELELRTQGGSIHVVLRNSSTVLGSRQSKISDDEMMAGVVMLMDGAGRKIADGRKRKKVTMAWRLAQPWHVPFRQDYITQHEHVPFSLPAVDTWIGLALCSTGAHEQPEDNLE